ncbi:hypothetical protein [Agrococcus jenensis]|uniref:Uncharacterized protein n=1 Tax=Agrococcus jenensis TaxID=46353 RepID=A0A3N2AQE0_9MICO|nr:hypothetical protein [Agrococcus jenensis]ROR65247.1 hypothetical protein EDD26_0612 [Agrococcus jenensis]
MAQVVRPQGFIGPLVVTVIGVILLFNGVPALWQWIGWVAQTALVVGPERAIEMALTPLLIAGGATFVGFLMLRGGFGALRSLMRGATQRAQAQVRGGVQQARGGVQQARNEVGQRYGEARAQAEHLQPSGQQGWFERIESLGREVEAERARRSGQPVAQQQPQRPQQQRPQQPQQRQPQQQRPPQPQPQRAPQPQQQPRAGGPGGERLGRIEELRQRVDTRVQQATRIGDAGTQAAQRVRQAAFDEAARVKQRQLPNPSDEVAALIGRLDLADHERVVHRGSSLTRSSLRTSALSKTSLSLNSLRQHRR